MKCFKKEYKLKNLNYLNIKSINFKEKKIKY